MTRFRAQRRPAAGGGRGALLWDRHRLGKVELTGDYAGLFVLIDNDRQLCRRAGRASRAAVACGTSIEVAAARQLATIVRGGNITEDDGAFVRVEVPASWMRVRRDVIYELARALMEAGYV